MKYGLGEGVYSATFLKHWVTFITLAENMRGVLPLVDNSETKDIIFATVNILLTTLKQNACPLWVLYVLVDLEENVSAVSVYE